MEDEKLLILRNHMHLQMNFFTYFDVLKLFPEYWTRVTGYLV